TQAVRLRTGLDLELSDPSWLTSFGVRERVLNDFGLGRVLIAGDAAHVHSPAGGHGMNTGIQDAINLAWKIGLISRGVAGNTTLRSYSEERSEIGRQIVTSSNHMTRLMTIQNPVMQFARNTAMHLALGFDSVQGKALRSLSMIDLNYRNFGLRSSSSIRRNRDSLHPGDRLPPIPLQSADGEVHVDELTRPDRLTLFVLESPGTPDFDKACEEMARTVERLPDALRPLVELVPIHASESSAVSRGHCFDVTGELRAQVGFGGHGAMLVRPDRYVAFFCGALDGQPIVNWFAGL
ncbi:MAG: FAD-dependent monooxygenase, partial [Phycisphaerales bacterium]|nr:FAD-dependent monooxygenase [Phycisphaerales bacterium]